MGIEEEEEEDPEMAHSHNREQELVDTSNSLLHNTRCCFSFPCFRSRRSSSTVGLAWWQIQSDDQWWSPGIRAVAKIREWSEIVAGPRWKTFIRRFNRNKSGGNRHGKFQYDPLSYALNFDEGQGQTGNLAEVDDFGGFRDFSTRYASVSPSGKAEVRNDDVAAFG